VTNNNRTQAAPRNRDRAETGSLTLKRGLRLLRVLARHPDGLSVSQLAGELDTHRAGIYRLLAPLVNDRLVTRDADGAHRLAAGLIELAAAVRPRLQEAARAQLERLADDLGATTALTVRDGSEAVVLAVVEPRNTDMHIAYRAGLRHRLDQAASGIAILAAMEPVTGERAAITKARARGWAISTGELIPGATGVAAPLAGLDASISAVWIDLRDEAGAAALVTAAASTIAGLLA
jgi:DNA-binding IclR family transcriptional regulator